MFSKIFFLGFVFCTFNFVFSQDDNLSRNSVNFKKISLREYVAKLKIDSSLIDDEENHFYILTTINKADLDWINEEDLPFLMSLIESKEPSYCVMQFISSQLLFEKSTIGGQVMNLIDSFRFKKQYPYFLVDCSKNDARRAEEIKRWWNEKIKIP